MRRQTFAGWLVHRPPAHEGLLQGKNLQKAGQRKQKAVPVEHATLPLLLPPHQPGRWDRLPRLLRSDRSGQLLRLPRSDQSGQLLRLLRLPRSDRWGQLLRLPRSDRWDQLLRLLRSDRWGQLLQLLRLPRSDQLLRSLQLLRLLQLARSDQWDPSVPWGQPVLCSSIRFVWMRCHLILHTS